MSEIMHNFVGIIKTQKMNMIFKKIAISSDHAGYELKEAIKEQFAAKLEEIFDFGTHSADSVDYPDFVHPLAVAVEQGKFEVGIVICGSGNGVNITANKHKGIRSALCWQQDIAMLARLHNNANILALPARFITKEEAFKITEAFLSTAFEGGRHQNRVEKICQNI
jgi:ribose 5-phosphate isomerase B